MASKQKKSVRTVKKPGDRRGTNPNSLANLRPWKAGGPSPNPSGKPKAIGLAYKAWLEQVNSEGMTNAEAVALSMGVQALQGDVSAAREIRTATEGDSLNLSGGVDTGEDVIRIFVHNGDADNG